MGLLVEYCAQLGCCIFPHLESTRTGESRPQEFCFRSQKTTGNKAVSGQTADLLFDIRMQGKVNNTTSERK